MNNDPIVNASRRDFLKAGAGLTLAVYAPLSFAAETGGPGKAGVAAAVDASFEPNAFVRIGADDSVTVISKHLEMGQGTYTGLATLVAEELDAAWPQIRVEGAPADAKRYNNLAWGPAQGTGGSSAILNSFEQMRKAGATARAMLVAAAADRWKVAPESITVSHGVVTHRASKRTARFGELANAASGMPVPEKVTLKKPADYIYIGKKAPRVDSKAKTTGTAMFTQDVKLPGMLTAVVAHAPRFGGKVRNFDASKAKAIRGVTDVVAINTCVAVLAKDFWSARKGRDALVVEWDDTNAFRQSSADITAQYTELAATEGAIAKTVGTPGAAGATRKMEATFHFPFLAHAAMEPLNCVVKLGKDSCEVWNGEQFQTSDQYALATVLGLKPEQIKLNMLFAGGSFGRRANPQSDYLVEAALIAKAIDGRVPVKLVWTREDDMRGGNYRPAYLHRIIAGLDAKNNLVAWEHRIVGQSILAGTAFESAMVKGGIDATSVEGATDLPYSIPAMQVELHTTKLGVPVQWWRSVGATHTAFSTETFIDDIAVMQGKDTVKFRMDMLDKYPRHKAVLALAAKQSGWDKPLATGKPGERRGRGIALHQSFETIVAEVAEVTIGKDNKLTIDRVVCALDCGIAVNPDVIRAQMEGGIGFGLSAALYGEITLKDGMVEQSNFNDYPVMRIADMPKIEVFIVESTEKPTGVGEPGVPVIAPALSNAIFAATGKRLRDFASQADVSEITGVLLAAGTATRFGSNKLLHPLPDGTPIALASALALRAALPKMLVVVRPDASALTQLLTQHDFRTVVAARAADGMGVSLAQSIAACADAQGWLVALADMPFIKPATMVAIADALRDGADIAAPVYQGQRGHPVGFTARFGPRLMALSGDEGARTIVRDHAKEVRQIECDDAGVLADIDRPGDLVRE